jgi:hypothetical protein
LVGVLAVLIEIEIGIEISLRTQCHVVGFR